MPIHSIRDLASAVRGRRIELAMSQLELARRAGVSRKWLYEFESGKPSSQLAFVLRVLDALDLVLDLQLARQETQAVDLDAILDEHRSL